ncbi:fl(2)d-associated complex component-like isoform X2 [Toxorhynchites rutilus septentrionalis]|uniref:fl(2)d-associated complex component-like isoform X2 n=1 Tax=Toxorhynchites rutilus septentrionalis TaxID=329112 RepID=UPI00247978C8|nr:fl(2)d-associated complex component-like isoform X2 [Toxorhynchites rutilus septentrionalis]
MSTPVKRKITLELNPNKKVLPKDRPSVFQRLGTKKFPSAGTTSGSGSVKQHQDQDSHQVINKEEVVKRIVNCDEQPEPVPPPKPVPESVSAHARLIEAQLAAKLGKVIVSRGETIGAVEPVVPAGGNSGVPNRNETERGSAHNSSAASGDRGGGGGGVSNSGPSNNLGGGGGSSSGAGGWDQSSLENADQDILERKRKELQQELKLEMDASGGGSGHHHHHHHSSSLAMKQKSTKETLVVKKVRKVPVPRRSSSSSDSSSSSGSDSSDSDSSSSSSSSSRDSRRVKKRGVRPRRGSSSSSDGCGSKKVIKKHVKKVPADGTKRIITKKIGGHLTTKIRVKKVTSPGGTSHIRKVARDVSPGGKVPTKYTIKKVVAVKKDKHSAVVDARERVREKERELALREKEREREKERLRHRERERELEQVKSRSPRALIRSRSPRSRLSPTSITITARGRELKKKSPEPARYREPVATVTRRAERSLDRVEDRRRQHEPSNDRERRERHERELVRPKEREEVVVRPLERPRERERLAVKEKVRRVDRDGDGGLEKPDRHRPVERLLPRPAERARALAAARSPGKPDRDRSRSPNSPRSRERIPRERSYERGAAERGGYIDHHDRRSRSREREYVAPIVRGARSRDSPYERHAPVVPVRETREYRENERGSGYERDRRDYARAEYPDDPLPRREPERDWEREREPDRAPSHRVYDRREEHGGRDWDRDHGPPPHSHSHDHEPYPSSSRNWEEPHWKDGSDGWANEKERGGDWKYKDRQWDHDDHPAAGAGQHTHNHGGNRRWPPGHSEQGQPSTWHGKPKEDLEFAPRHKLAGRLGEGGGGGGGNNDRPMFRRQGHQGHTSMFHHGRKPHLGPGRFGNKYSLNRTQQNLSVQHQHQGSLGPNQQQPGTSRSASAPRSPNAQQQNATVPSINQKEVNLSISEQIASGQDGAPPFKSSDNPSAVARMGEHAISSLVGPAEWDEPMDSPAPIEPKSETTTEATAPVDAVVESEKAPEPIAEPLEEDNLSEISDDPDDILTREEEITQAIESSGADKLSSGDPNALGQGANDAANIGSDELLANSSSLQSQQSNTNWDHSGDASASGQEAKDAKEAGKLHANKELKEEMDLDFEEISDGELEEENKFKGLGDALGVDWASLTLETRAKLKPEQTIPVSARNRWKAHHILLDIGISVRLAGEAYAQRVLTESKEKLREEIDEFKAAAERKKVAAVKKEEEEQMINGVKIKKEILDEDDQEARKEAEQDGNSIKKEEGIDDSKEATEQETNLAEMDKILHPVAAVHVAMRERLQARRNLILHAAGPHSRALSARRDLEIRRQLCGFPPQECNERITEHQTAPTNPELHETVMKLFMATVQPKKIEVQ